ncbi:hypothetical protein GCM10027031_16370 [Corynebacterium atrinae]
MSTTEPGTTPEPNTRSSSPIPEDMAVAAAPLIWVIGIAGLEGVSPRGTSPDTAAVAALPALGATADSTNVPHDPQSGQRPSHLGEE